MMFGNGVDQLRRIPLAAVMRQTGAQPDRYDKAKWHTPKGAISITGLKFMNWHRSAGGGGAIDLVMHLNDLGFPAAVAWLQRHFPLPPVVEPPPPARRLALPPSDRGRLSAVKHYLVQDRAIPPAMTDALIASGKLYADRRGNAVGVEKRGQGPARGLDGRAVVGPLAVEQTIDQRLDARAQGIEHFVIVSHNFEMLRSDSSEPDRFVVKRFEQLCEFLAQHSNEFVVGGFAPDAHSDGMQSGSAPLPAASRRATARRYAEQVLRRFV